MLTDRRTGAVAIGRRISWSMVDQVLSSMTNFALTVFVAGFASANEFGAFAIVLATYLVLVGIGQGLIAQPFAVRHSAGYGRRTTSATSRAAGAALGLGIAAAFACVIAGALTPAPLGRQLVTLGLVAPGLLLQDTWRFVFVAAGRPQRAAWNDAAWVLVQAAGFALLVWGGRPDPLRLIAAWGIAGCLAAALGCAQAGLLPNPIAIVAWLRDEGRLGLWFAAQSLVIRGAGQLMYVMVAIVAGLGAAGTIRGAQVLFSPLTLLYQGILLAAVPEGVRIVRASARSFPGFTRTLAAGATGCAVAWSLSVLVLPAGAGRELLGATWDASRPLAPILAVQVVAVAASMGPQVGLRALGAARRCLATDILQATLLLAGGAAGALAADAAGAALGIAAGTVGAMLVWWAALETARPVAQTESVAGATGV